MENNENGKLFNFWIWFQKHAFTSILFIAFGVIIGISYSKIVYERDMTKAINIQRFEFKGDLFDVQPSAIKKYYDTKIMEKTNVK